MQTQQTETQQQAELTKRIIGHVSKHLKGRSYGFIRGDDGLRYFFHRTNVAGERVPKRGTPVRFIGIQDHEEGQRRRAINIEVIQ